MGEREQAARPGPVAPRRPRLLPWALANLGLFLLTLVVGGGVIGVFQLGGGGLGLGLYGAAFLLPVLFPGWLLHLVIIGLLPLEWPRSRARIVSIVASPFWLIIPLLTEGVIVSPMHVVAVAYGAVARLRQPRELRD